MDRAEYESTLRVLYVINWSFISSIGSGYLSLQNKHQCVLSMEWNSGYVHSIFKDFFRPKCDAFSADIMPFDSEILIFQCAIWISLHFFFFLTFLSLTSYSCFKFSVSFCKIMSNGWPAIKLNIKSLVLSEVLHTQDKHSHNVHVWSGQEQPHTCECNNVEVGWCNTDRWMSI
jgi:hypothetical protein